MLILIWINDFTAFIHSDKLYHVFAHVLVYRQNLSMGYRWFSIWLSASNLILYVLITYMRNASTWWFSFQTFLLLFKDCFSRRGCTIRKSEIYVIILFRIFYTRVTGFHFATWRFSVCKQRGLSSSRKTIKCYSKML